MTTKNNDENEVVTKTVLKEVLVETLGVFKSEIKSEITNEIIIEIDKLAVATKKGFDEVHEKFRIVNQRLDRIEGRLDNIEQNHGGRLTILEAQMKMVYPK